MEENINNELAINFDDEIFTSIIDCEEFYFQKGREALNKWLDCKLDDTIQRRLFKSIKDYNYFKNLNTDDEFFELKELFFEIISYCDLHANDKEKYNKYLDKRVLAKAGVRMSPWITHLYNYKYFPDKANVTVKNALDVLKDPINNINSISITHRRLISKYYLKSEYDELTFVDGLKSCFSEIPTPNVLENRTILIAKILYNQKEKWMSKPNKFKDFTESLKKYLAEENLPFQIVKEEKDWFWIADSEGNFNSEEIHYELIIEQNQINIDLHFEKSKKTAQYFRSLIDSLPAFLRWKEWGKWGKCISHVKKISLDDADAIENAISYLNELYDYTIDFYRKDKRAMKEKVRLLKYKKQIILQGPPGTGKTREAKLIAKEMIGVSDVEELTNHKQFKIVQFHPSYTYEDFVRGIVAKPNEEGDGVFYEAENKVLADFAQRAIDDADNNYVLIIDEINRANLSSVLGELIYALEYRDGEVESMYGIDGDKKLVLPFNLYIIGTMNTADRSVGHIDYAIRRRFAFVDVLPEKLEDNNEIFFNGDDFDLVSALFTKEFVSDEFEVKDIQIGHSYFIAKKKDVADEEEAKVVFSLKMKYEIIPILREYLKDGVFKEIVSTKIEELETKWQG